MYFGQILDYYSRDDVQKLMMQAATGREVAGVSKAGAFGQRPNSLQYPADIVSMVRGGALEFHCSIERWSQPMAIRTDNYASLRTGWDFVIDIDCDDFTHGRAAAGVVCRALGDHGISKYSVKFTGGTGFHIGVPWGSMPEKVDGKPSASMFPNLPRAMCSYLKDYCRPFMEEALMKLGDAEKLAEQAKVELADVLTKDGIDPFRLVEIDSVLISPRHLFRMPYSLNSKSMLASLPVKPSELAGFERHDAEPGKFKAALGFLDSSAENEAASLVAEALDWQSKNKKRADTAKPSEKFRFEKAVEPEHFPPCIKSILAGLADGRKRSLFILTCFLSSAGWKWEDIEKAVDEWNLRNSQQLPDSTIRAHLRSAGARMQLSGKGLTPPSCANEGWYDSIGVCNPDETCGGAAKTVKNPINYPRRRLAALEDADSRKAKLQRGVGRRRTTFIKPTDK
jgi:hypothetical protein